MIYIVAFGKLLIGIGVILLLVSIVPWIISCTKDTPHGVDSWRYTMSSLQGWGIGIALFGLCLILLPILLPIAWKLVLVILEVIFTIITLPFQLLL